MREADLAKPVMDWFVERGFLPYGEVEVYSRAVDIVAIKDVEVESVELKLSLTKGVIRQANQSLAFSHRSWCAIPTLPRNLDERIQKGWLRNLGVLRVLKDRIEVIRDAPRIPTPFSSNWTEKAIKACKRYEPLGIAGVPQLLGKGPAQDVFVKVAAYRSLHPKATWREIYEAIPNHYAHARSMQNAMGIVELKNARRRCIVDLDGRLNNSHV